MKLDRTLAKVTKVFRAAGAYRNPVIPRKPISTSHCPYDPAFRKNENPYLAVQNLFYIADKDPHIAARRLSLPAACYAEPVPASAKFIWCAWGVDPPVSPLSLVFGMVASNLPSFGINRSATAIPDGVLPLAPYHPRTVALLAPYHPRSYYFGDMTAVAKEIAKHL